MLLKAGDFALRKLERLIPLVGCFLAFCVYVLIMKVQGTPPVLRQEIMSASVICCWASTSFIFVAQALFLTMPETKYSWFMKRLRHDVRLTRIMTCAIYAGFFLGLVSAVLMVLPRWPEGVNLDYLTMGFVMCAGWMFGEYLRIFWLMTSMAYLHCQMPIEYKYGW